MKKFSYGFDATKQERNTINRQISRMEKRGYIFPKDIRSKIKTTKGLPDFLYEHSVYQPFLRGSTEKRVKWNVPGSEGKALERAVDKVNRENRRLYKKGLLEHPVVVHPSGISGLPGTWKPSFFKKSEATISREASEAIREFIRKTSRPLEERLRERFNKDRDNFIDVVEDLLKTYITDRTDTKARAEIFEKIEEKLRAMTIEEWLTFVRTSRFNVKLWYDSKTKKRELQANLETLLEELGIPIDAKTRATVDDLGDALLVYSDFV